MGQVKWNRVDLKLLVCFTYLMANTAAVVHFIKHWDNNTKGSISFSDVASLREAFELAERHLKDEILDADVLGQFDELFSVTKAELVDSVQSYAGHVSSL